MKVNILEAKNRLSELIRAVQAGEEVIIANRGQPVARLTAINENVAPGHPVGSREGLLEWMRNNRLPPEKQRSAADIDADIQAIRDDGSD